MHATHVAHRPRCGTARPAGHPADRTAPDRVDPDRLVDDEARREVAEALGQHLASGALRMTEYEERLERAFSARTRGALDAVLADLPAVTTARERHRRRVAARGMVLGWLAMAAMFVAIWALAGGGYFWPVWPIMGTAMGTLPGAVALLRT